MPSRDDPAVILYIEDEDALREELAEDLGDCGYEVITAPDGASAERILAKLRPDLVLCDVMLPGRSGFELLRDFRAQGRLDPATAFIFLTALYEREPRLAGLRAGAEDYITKPIDLDLLHLKIENCLAFAARMRGAGAARDPAPDVHLSPREREVLGLIGQGQQSAQIAHDLGISQHTVNQHIKRLYRKLDVKNRSDATRAAIALGL